MQMSPSISVIIPLYNKEKSIKKTIKSVLDQTYTNFEIVVVDDGSTDNSVEILTAIGDDRIIIIHKENEGVSSARNYGIKCAKGEYIFFLDADDLIFPACMQEYINLTELYKEEVVFVSNFKIVAPNGDEVIVSHGKNETLVKHPLKEQWFRNIYPRTGSMLIHKACFDNVGTFMKEIDIFEDLEFTIRLMKRYQVVYTPLILMSYQVEYLQQSKKIQALSNEFANYINLNTDNFYEKLILSQNLYCAFIKRRRMEDINAEKYLFNKNKDHIPFILFSMVFKKTIDLYYRVSKR
jgi:glycosyltransferase involved in cell wall biosynthesis